MDELQKKIGRRRFLSLSSIALVSPWITKRIPKILTDDVAYGAEQSGKKKFESNVDWLNLTVEEAIEPDLPICDPHHHLWRRSGNDYLLKDLLQDIRGGHSIRKTVYIEARAEYRTTGPEELKYVGETEFVVAESASVKSQTEVAAGIVGYADLMIGNAVVPLLEAHIKAGKGRFKGIRLAPRSKITDSKFLEGFSTFSKYNLSLDAIGAKMPELANLAQAFPDIPIIVNHIGSPSGIGANDENAKKVFEDWKTAVRTLVPCKNIYMKLGGLGMNSFKFGFNNRPAPVGSDELAILISPYFSYCIEQLGVDRCMFESNFPPDKAAYSYTVMWNAFKKFSKGFSASERSALFYDTAVRAYRLKS